MRNNIITITLSVCSFFISCQTFQTPTMVNNECTMSNMNDMKYYGHIYIESQINGVHANLAFDTGSPYLCLDSIFVDNSPYTYKNLRSATMGGAGNGYAKVEIIVDEATYTLKDTLYTSRISPIFELKPILGDYADGLLGMSEMGEVAIAIDYQNEKIGFWDKCDSTDIEGFTMLRIRYSDTKIYLPITITVDSLRTIEGEAEIDLGSGGSVSLTSTTAAKYNLSSISPLLHFSDKYGGVGGGSSSCDFRARSLTIGPFVLPEVTMDFSNNTTGALSNRDHIAIIGNDIWERFDMIIDIPNQQLYLRPNNSFNTPFESPSLGFGYTDRHITLGCWKVNGIYKDSNAEKAGLRNDDTITAVNGINIKEIDIEQQKTLFRDLDTISLTIERDSISQIISFVRDEDKI